MGLFDRKEKYIRINPNRSVRNGLITKCQKFQMNFLQNVLVVNKLFIKRTWDKLKFVQIVLIPSVSRPKNVLI